MNFYNEPSFWAFLTASVSSIFGLIRMFFVYYERSQENAARLSASVERLKSDNILKALSCLDEFRAKIEPMVARHEVLMKDLENSVKMTGIIEKGLTGQFATLSHQYEGFQSKVTNVTAGMQMLMDRVDKLDKDFKMKLGTVTRRP